MLAALRSRSLSLSSSSSSSLLQQWKLGFPAAYSRFAGKGLTEVEKVVSDVKVIQADKHCEWADFMVLTTGRSTWHVKNIAQALFYKTQNVECIFHVSMDASFIHTKKSEATRLMDVKYLSVKDHVKKGEICVEHIDTKLMIADPLTKPLAVGVFKDHVANMGLHENFESAEVWE